MPSFLFRVGYGALGYFTPKSCWKNETIELKICWTGEVGWKVGGPSGMPVGIGVSVADGDGTGLDVGVLGARVAVGVLVAVGVGTGKCTMRGSTHSARSPVAEPSEPT